MKKPTDIMLLRSDSTGIAGTIANAQHHAQHILPFIDAMKDAVKYLGFKRWKQGNNVHQFITHENRTLVLRPICNDGQSPFYCGVRLALKLGRTSTDEHRLMEITDPAEVPRMLEMMRAFAEPRKGRLNSGHEKTMADAALKKAA
jgi:hypothetical protein